MAYYKKTNTNLFTSDGTMFFCPICKEFKPISRFLSELWKDNEKTLYVASMITEVKRFHMKQNILLIQKQNPELIPKINRSAMSFIIENEGVLDFLKKERIGPDHFGKLPECDKPLKERILRRYGF